MSAIESELKEKNTELVELVNTRFKEVETKQQEIQQELESIKKENQGVLKDVNQVSSKQADFIATVEKSYRESNSNIHILNQNLIDVLN